MKEIKFNCPRCGQDFEASVQTAGTQVNCPTCGIDFTAPARNIEGWKWVLFILIALAIPATLEYKQQRADAEFTAFAKNIDPSYGELPFQTQERMEGEAKAAMLKECSNYIGFSRVVDSYVAASEDKPVTNWTGDATIDYVNKFGGIERTNLLFSYWVFDHRAFAQIDSVGMWNRYEKEQARRREVEERYSSQ